MKKLLVLLVLLGSLSANAQTFPVNNLLVESTTNSTSTTTGAAIIAGGIGVAQDLRLGGTLYGLGVLSGGSINGMTIGAASPSTGAFTSLSSSNSAALAGINASNKVNITGTTFSNTGIAAATNGNWFTSGPADITYHSVVGDAFNTYFTSALTQFTATQASPDFQSGYTVNVTQPTGSTAQVAGILISEVAKGQQSAWAQANDLVVASTWTGPNTVAYNTELDITNNAGDPLAGGSTQSINDLVLGGFPGPNPITAGLSIFEPNSPFWAHYGIQVTGNFSAKDATFLTDNNATRDYYLQGSHAIGIDMTLATFSAFPIEGSNFNVDTNGHFNTTSDQRLKIDHPEKVESGLKALKKVKVHEFAFQNSPNKLQEGFFAQELYEVYPQCVHKGGIDPKTEPWSVDYGCLTPLLVKSVQELSAEVQALKHPRR